MDIVEQEKWSLVFYRMNNEGFHYCFTRYSTFPEIEDERFHELREEYIKISEKLEEYVTIKVGEEYD